MAMKHRNSIFCICAAMIFVAAAGCGKLDAPQDMGQRAPTTAQEPLATPPLPRLPDPKDPDVANRPEVPTPLPGQANDHSTEKFKDGGKEDPNK